MRTVCQQHFQIFPHFQSTTNLYRVTGSFFTFQQYFYRCLTFSNSQNYRFYGERSTEQCVIRQAAQGLPWYLFVEYGILVELGYVSAKASYMVKLFLLELSKDRQGSLCMRLLRQGFSIYRKGSLFLTEEIIHFIRHAQLSYLLNICSTE
ncbi:hypothetical protein BDF20DRAFT_839287 [Mycotypha africana]|uniref:uncharacterized protein n=1 Tax=Mycotypha africana TaxID=64632 RepID=UPI002300AA89|nr:uncharacterized protein BDF20DRAFT_839287 [Mycotypha africana]KAI8968161.1 hypothetical protein BDF20DRAFT_839287 [Mycotypha africana]